MQSTPHGLRINQGYPAEGIGIPIGYPLPNPAYLIPNLLQPGVPNNFSGGSAGNASSGGNLSDLHHSGASQNSGYNPYGGPGVAYQQANKSRYPNSGTTHYFQNQAQYQNQHYNQQYQHGPSSGRSGFGQQQHGYNYNSQNASMRFHQQASSQQFSQQGGHYQNNRGGAQGGQGSSGNVRKKKQVFEPYWPMEDVSQKLESKELIKGSVRINAKNYKHGYVAHPSGDADIYIHGVNLRNRALNDDIVAMLLEPKKNWRVFESSVQESRAGNAASPSLSSESEKQSNNMDYITLGDVFATDPELFDKVFGVGSSSDGSIDLDSNTDPTPSASAQDPWWRHVQRTGRVVAIVRKLHSRACVGHLKMQKDPLIIFEPLDHRVPRLVIQKNECPQNFLKRPDDFKNVRFVGTIQDWPEDGIYAKGSLQRSLGDTTLVEGETIKILVDAGINTEEFPDSILTQLPSSVIPAEEYSKRRDLRGECVFTIDPSTARDLDDAVHVKAVEGQPGCLEVGVHIADVSFYVPENTELDRMAANRATTVYMVQKAIPMLPRQLCEELCSLNPAEDKLAYSVIWIFGPDAKIRDTWFGRTVIRSCAKLSYQDAQCFIDGREWSADQFPKIYEPFNIDTISTKVSELHKLTQTLRNGRFSNGALRLDQLKLGFTLSDSTGLPNGCHPQQLQESNFLIEELMLLANISVAEMLYRRLPQFAFLRRHPPPAEKSLDDVAAQTRAIGLNIDTSSAAALQETIFAHYRSASVNGDLQSLGANQALVNICSKAMQLAQYFCAGKVDDGTAMSHYALNVPMYTHFTSPIRRYADVLVHRQLTAVLTAAQKIGELEDTTMVGGMTCDQLQGQAEWCNKKKKDAKTAQENSVELFYAVFVKECGPLNENCIVLGVLDKALDILIASSGVIKRIYCEQLELERFDHSPGKQQGCGTMTLLWKRTQNCSHTLSNTSIKPLDILRCSLIAVHSQGGGIRVNASLIRPTCHLCDQ